MAAQEVQAAQATSVGQARTDEVAVHATGVVVGSRALLIMGLSRVGKSRTACALIRASTPRRPIRLLGDDRILLRATGRGVLARPHPRIAGFIEKRGLGIVAEAYVEQAEVAGLLMLRDVSGRATQIPRLLQNFPCLTHVYTDAGSGAVLSWWRDACTTPDSDSTPFGVARVAKD